ncbi:hypothetical protein B0H14DRAFT_2587998 [Mycena olivaceomarginata]|nr:hypothetical protein B0H14DRAFT_2587998 [Mycena olivaceomarginata]
MREGTLEATPAWPRWIILLCGGTHLHWILAWVDYATYEIGIFDSIPELGSTSWGSPYSYSQWTLYESILAHPKLHGIQACELCVGMALKAMADGNGASEWVAVADPRKDLMLESISSLLVTPRVPKFKAVTDANMREEEEPETASAVLAIDAESASRTPLGHSSDATPTASVFLKDIDVVRKIGLATVTVKHGIQAPRSLYRMQEYPVTTQAVIDSCVGHGRGHIQYGCQLYPKNPGQRKQENVLPNKASSSNDS